MRRFLPIIYALALFVGVATVAQGQGPFSAQIQRAMSAFGLTRDANGVVSFSGAVDSSVNRINFDQPCLTREHADLTAELVTDAAVNIAVCPGFPHLFTYRLDGAQATPFLVKGGSLDIDNDGADNEGVEIVLADSTTTVHGVHVVGTSPAQFVRFNVTITSVSGTDNAYFGWRLAEAFVDDLVLGTYDTYGVYFINDNAGNLQIQTGANGTDATDEEDQVETWADAATHTVEVRVTTAGAFSFYIDGVASTITLAIGAAESGDILIPFFGMLNAADADTELTINWIEVGEV